MRTAADTLTPVVLELGGKDAAIVCDDCDFDQVVDIAMRGTFQNCGQNCIGLERLVIHSKIYDRFVQAVAAKVAALSQGPPLSATVDCGAMTMGAAEIGRIEKLVQQAVDSGARLLAGGKRNDTLPEGSFMRPTLLVDVTRNMDIARNEVFGPVMTVIRAEDDDDAVAIVNSTPYGLGGSVFSLDYDRAGAIGRRLRTGMMNLNDFGVNYLCQSLPFGGVNISGFDRFAGIEGLRGCCNPRAVTSDKVTGVRTAIPPPLQYPVGESGFQFVSGLISMFYGDGLVARVGGIFSLIAASAKGKPVPTKQD
jgi:aldehyde dehydrogenase (NAD+)